MRILEITVTDTGWACVLSQRNERHSLGTISGSLGPIVRGLLEAGADPDLIVTKLTHRLDIDVLPRAAAVEAPGTWLLAEEWESLVDSQDGRYWTPNESLESSRPARAYFEGTAFIQVQLQQRSDGREVIACPGRVYVSVPLTASRATTDAISRLACGCCASSSLALLRARLRAVAAGAWR